MNFPLAEYQAIIDEAQEIVEDRDEKGRNDYLTFWEGFPHGSQDVTFEIWRRAGRVLGAEQSGDAATMRADLLDALNYCAFAIMLLDREQRPGPPVS